MNLIQCLDNSFSVTSFAIVAISVAAWVIALIAQVSRIRAKNPDKKALATKVFFAAILTFGGLIALEFLVAGIVKSEAQNQFTLLLNSEIASVDIDGKPLSNPALIISDTRRLDASLFRYHHSHPTHSIVVVLHTKKGDLRLNLARDSGNPHEYWVFYPSFKVTSLNDIGKVVTNALDGY